MYIFPCLCPSQLWRRRKHTLQTLRQRYLNKSFKKVIENKDGETNSQSTVSQSVSQQSDGHTERQTQRDTKRQTDI